MTAPRSRAGIATAAVVLALCTPVVRAAEIVRIRVDDPVVDRNGDGFQDVIVIGRAVHHDLDFDGVFDYSLAFAFKEYTPEGHRRYLASGFAPDVFAELTRAGLDNLCASERVAANWTAAHFREFGFYHDGYGRLQIFDGSPVNDGRLAGKSPLIGNEYTVNFNPDGSVANVQRGDRTVALAQFDYEKNISTGIRLMLPRIVGPSDLAGIRAELGRLFEATSGAH